MIDVVRRVGRRARMLGRVDGEVLGQLLEEGIPGEAPRAVEEDERRAGALRQHPDPHLLLPDRDRLLAHHAPPAATAAARGDMEAAPRSRSGHQWLTHPSSYHVLRSCGNTSRPKR